ADERVDSAARLLPDLRAGGFVVTAPVGGVFELAGPYRIRRGLCSAASDVVVVGLVGERLRGHDANVCTQCPKQIDFLLRLIVGYDDDGAVAARVAQERKRDAGVSRSAFHDGPAAAQAVRA